MKKPVGILHVKVLRAQKLLNTDFLSKSDPYVKLSLGGDRLPAKKTTVKMNTLNPVWNEDFKLTVKDPESQVLQLHLYDWEKVRILISHGIVASSQSLMLFILFFCKKFLMARILVSDFL